MVTRGGRPRPPRSTRGHRVSRQRSTTNHRLRLVSVRFLLVASLIAAGLKLVEVQGFEAEALSAKASKQRALRIDIHAERGDIVDRNGVKLAFSMETRALSYRPRAMREQEGADFEARTAAIASFISRLLGPRVNEKELLRLLRLDTTFTYLVENVEPAQEREIRKRFPEIGSEKRAERQYPGGSLASNIVGFANWRKDDPNPTKHNLQGLAGLENYKDTLLAGESGSVVVDTEEGVEGVVIPGTERDRHPATNGSNLELTIDADVQYDLQRKLADYTQKTGAKGGSAVVLDAHTGEVYALANSRSFDPNAPTLKLEDMGNPAVSTPYEPGSVNKLITAAAAIEHGLTTPSAPNRVPASPIKVSDTTIGDAWPHGPMTMTTAGIFAKSSNIGTVLLAQRVGPERWLHLADLFGLGKRTEVGLPGESAGTLPPRSQWSGPTFANLSFGQGLSMTVLQMAGMYQAIANNGVRVPPRIIKSTIRPDGTRQAEPRPEGVRVVSEQTALTVRDMFRAVVQRGPGQNVGTGKDAALPGYQISGKTGTGQQVDPATGRYSDTKNWITFAGILPADNPRFVVGLMLDAPNAPSAAPLFHDVASYLAQRYNLPLSREPSPVVPLVLG